MLLPVRTCASVCGWLAWRSLSGPVVLAQWRLLVAVLVLGALGGAAVLVVGVAWGVRRGLVLLVALGAAVLGVGWGVGRPAWAAGPFFCFGRRRAGHGGACDTVGGAKREAFTPVGEE